jgi:hypothetical protein
VFQELPVKSVNNVHLVCRNLHQIANLYPNRKLSFSQDSPKHLESLYKSTRTFKELAFADGSDQLWRPEKFELLEGLISFTGSQIKTLTIRGMNPAIRMKVDQLIFQKLLNLLPNLQTLEVDGIECKTANKESIKWDLKSTKIKSFKIIRSTGLENLLESLEKCAIRELELNDCPEKDSEAIQKFLKSQEKNLKRLTIIRTECNFPVGLTDLQLEHFGYGYDDHDNVSLEFLKQHVDLSSLTLYMGRLSDEDLNTILELKSLDSLQLRYLRNESSGLENLYRLEKLKRLTVYGSISRNILDHLRFGVYNNLEELDACFRAASLQSIREMKRCTPKLKKLEIVFGSPQTINALLETLDNLETMEVSIHSVFQPSEKVYPKIKQFSVNDFNFNVEQFTQQFPNLEALKCVLRFVQIESFFATLLSGLKQLKTLVMRIWCDDDVDPEPVLQWILRYGKHMEEAKIVFVRSGLNNNMKNSFCIRKGFLV